ncbi:N-acetylneuraminic acid synthase [Oratosquilla oratoria]|uniref:N-acetylneuraminic acid synthase n=1 Tax=Oratosquilla oratoria TaxID=337810 RepID=UPI003F7711D8
MEPLELCPGRWVGAGFPCFIIAEIGQNHQGDIEIAKKLITKAKECGADCVKLQKSSLKTKFNKAALARPYVSPHSWGPTYGAHKQHLEFNEEQFRALQKHAESLDIPLTASAMDMESVSFLERMRVPFIKIGSGDADNLPLIRKAAATRKPLILSTGMQDLAWVSKVYRELEAMDTSLVLLQCTSSYPTPPDEAHLRVMDIYRTTFPRAHVGYSGHERDIFITVAAVARSARVVERHVTLNHSWKGSDHACSLEPHQLRQMVRAIRCVEAALGSPLKARQPSEEECYRKLGKTVVATRKMPVGHIIQKQDIMAKVAEPKGIRAFRLEELEGKVLKVEVLEDASIREDDVDW